MNPPLDSGELDHDVDRKDWVEIGLKYGGGGAALVALQPEGYLVGCVSPGALFILRDDGYFPLSPSSEFCLFNSLPWENFPFVMTTLNCRHSPLTLGPLFPHFLLPTFELLEFHCPTLSTPHALNFKSRMLNRNTQFSRGSGRQMSSRVGSTFSRTVHFTRGCGALLASGYRVQREVRGDAS
jgi:hypothetical protein